MPCRKCDRAYADLFHPCSIDIACTENLSIGCIKRYRSSIKIRERKFVMTPNRNGGVAL